MRTLDGKAKTIAIVALSISGGLVATLLMPIFIPTIQFDYDIYMQGARLIRAGQNPYVTLPFWYPLPIALFTIVPWSFLPDRFFWAFAFIPLGLLHLRYERNTVLWWMFYPVLINVYYGQAEGWLLLPLMWVLEDAPVKSSLGILALAFKPAYAMLLAPYRVWEWLREKRWKDLAWLFGLGGVMLAAAFLVDLKWIEHWLSALMRRGDAAGLIERDMTIWAFPVRGSLWLIPMGLFLATLILLAIPALRAKEMRGDVLLVISLFIFPNGLNPVSSMMVLPFAQTRTEIITLVAVSWLVVGMDVLVGGFGGLYLVIVLVALAIRLRRYRQNSVVVK